LDSYSGGYEEFYLLAYNVMQPAESQSIFQSKMSTPSSWSKNRSNNKPARKAATRALNATCFHTGFLLFNPEDEGDMFL
jgi:hypothetical protein